MSSTIKFDVCNRFTGKVQFTAEIECAEAAALHTKIRAAVLWAITARANLSCADLSGANLSGANLSGANLFGADLSGADLSDANLSCADLSGANLFGADLSGADLSDANLSCADLSGANLSDANLSGANLSGANLFGADLSGASRCGGFIQWWWIAGPQGSRLGMAIAMWIEGVGLRWTVGCRADCTTEDLRTAVACYHSETAHEADYLHLIACVENHPGLKRAMEAHKIPEAAE